MAHPMPGVEQREISANHHGGVHPRFHQDVGHHRGGGGFSVGAGNADGIFIGFHNLAPGLGTLKHRNAGAAGCRNLGIVIVGGSGADNAVRPLNIFGTMANGHMDSFFNQLLCGKRSAHIRAGNLQPHSLQHQSQWPHRNAANANQMHPTAGNDVFRNITGFHKNNSPTRAHIHTILNYTS